MFENLFYVDQLSGLILLVIGIVGVSVISFSRRYLEGDGLYGRFFGNIITLIICVVLMSISDHAVLFLFFWGMGNVFLVRLMMHKKSWEASRQSGILAGKYFTFGFFMISSGIGLLVYSSRTTSIHQMIYAKYDDNILCISLILLLLGAMAQSAIFPFHKWLISSLNSPTPVSAIMHAGLVNGGGFLLTRFAPLYVKAPYILDVIFVAGLVTAIMGTLWKLIQHDVKKMLACSTMGQMGFMMVQFGLGLFPAALTHLCFHGFFKAYLFLASGSAAREKKLELNYPPRLLDLILSFFIGILGIITFAFVGGKNLMTLDTNLFVFLITFVASVQFALPIVSNDGRAFKMIPVAVMGVISFTAFYAMCVAIVENILEPLNLIHSEPLNWIHIVGGGILCFLWIIMMMSNHLAYILDKFPYMQRLYVLMLGSSQPAPKTITSFRNNYRYKA